jgi:hypothetical protein
MLLNFSVLCIPFIQFFVIRGSPDGSPTLLERAFAAAAPPTQRKLSTHVAHTRRRSSLIHTPGDAVFVTLAPAIARGEA